MTKFKKSLHYQGNRLKIGDFRFPFRDRLNERGSSVRLARTSLEKGLNPRVQDVFQTTRLVHLLAISSKVLFLRKFNSDKRLQRLSSLKLQAPFIKINDAIIQASASSIAEVHVQIILLPERTLRYEQEHSSYNAAFSFIRVLQHSNFRKISCAR